MASGAKSSSKAKTKSSRKPTRSPASRRKSNGQKRSISKPKSLNIRTPIKRKTTRRKSRKKTTSTLGLSNIFWRKTALASFGLLIWFVVLGSLTLRYFSAGLPDTSTIWNYSQNPSISIYDQAGQKMTTRGQAYGYTISLHELPPHLPQAVIAVEDRRFYHHKGIDVIGISRAFVTNIQHGRILQGGSTITQQLARNLFLTSDRTFKRKVQEVLLAFKLESRFTKDQILSLYMNKVYLGSGAYGVEAASQNYFNRSAKDISIYQSALLAGLLKAPSRYSPKVSPDKAHSRAVVVLGTMKEAGYLTQADVAHALSHAEQVAPEDASTHNQYFADWIAKEIKKELSFKPLDLRVHTTLDASLQALATRTLKNAINRDGREYGFSEAAIVVLDQSGAVKAMVGGHSYRKSQFNRVTQAKRQPGSAFKPFVYLAALERGLSPDSIILDAPIKVGNWTPQNYGNRYLGRVSLKTALSKSLNSATVRVAQYARRDKIIDAATKLGIESPLAPNLSLALGTSEVTLLELASAYVAFMNGGYKTGYHGISRMENMDGRIIFDADLKQRKRVITPKLAAQMNEMLSEVMKTGTGRNAALGLRPSAGKTGTTQSNKDAWFVGYTRDLLTAVWIGNDDATPMSSRTTGGSAAALVWVEFMTQATADMPVRNLAGLETHRLGTSSQSSELPTVIKGKMKSKHTKSIGDLIASLSEKSNAAEMESARD